MRRATRMAALAGAGVVAAAWCLPAVAGAGQLQGPAGPGGAVRGNAPVYVQTNDITGNQVVTYVPSSYGGLRQIGRADTGGLGVKLGGAAVDDLASQGGLAYDPSDQLLVGVNGGSNTIFEFHTFGLSVGLPSVVSSGGTIPVSVAVRGNLVYVLNAGGSGAVQGFYANTLQPIPGGWRSLGLTAGASPQYLNTPGQIGFSPDGRQLIVTTKANGSDIDVLSVSAVGGLSAPTVNKSATPVPFGFTFDQWGHLVVTEAGTSAVTTYAVSPSGTTTELGSVTDGLTALCWIAGDGGRFFYGSNAGSATVTTYTLGTGAKPLLIGSTATDAGPIDLATTPDGSDLYVETGGSDLIDTFAVSPTGALIPTGKVAPELPGHTGLEGVAVG